MPSPALAPAVFLDRDGTLMEEVDYCRDPAKVRLLPGVIAGLARLKAAGFRAVIITNQSGIGRGRITEVEYAAVHARLLALIGPGLIDATYYCPDAPDHPSTHRKPLPGMVHEAGYGARALPAGAVGVAEDFAGAIDFILAASANTRG